MKKIISFILAIMMVATLGVTAFADETPNYASMSNKKLSEISGITIEELVEARAIYGEEFGSVIADYIKRTTLSNEKNELSKTETSRISTRSMSNSNWLRLSENFISGQILLTDQADIKDIYTHGHVAILYDETTTVEHIGKKEGTDSPNYDEATGKYLSGNYDVSWWKDHYTRIKTLNYSSETVMRVAGIYAYNNLQGIPYNAIAPKNNSSVVNCASLVWKAYNNYGVNILDSNRLYALPKDFDTSSKLTTVSSVDWNNAHFD